MNSCKNLFHVAAGEDEPYHYYIIYGLVAKSLIIHNVFGNYSSY